MEPWTSVTFCTHDALGSPSNPLTRHAYRSPRLHWLGFYHAWNRWTPPAIGVGLLIIDFRSKTFRRQDRWPSSHGHGHLSNIVKSLKQLSGLDMRTARQCAEHREFTCYHHRHHLFWITLLRRSEIRLWKHHRRRTTRATTLQQLSKMRWEENVGCFTATIRAQCRPSSLQLNVIQV